MKPTIEEYLESKGFDFRIHGGELVMRCVFDGCDQDTRHHGHFYVSLEKGVFMCHHCGKTGNMVTLSRHLGDDPIKLGFKSNKRNRYVR